MRIEDQIKFIQTTQKELHRLADAAPTQTERTTLRERADALHFVIISLQRLMRLQSAITELITS